MAIDDNTTFEISTRGDVEEGAIERARERLTRVGSHCREPVFHVEFRVTDDPESMAVDRARAEATLSVTRGPVRAHAQGPTIEEAIDLMIERLRRRVDRHESRLHRVGSKRHDGVATEGSWHHGDARSTPRHPRPIADEPAAVVRRKSFTPSPMTVEEAAFDLDILDHDFYLFEEVRSGDVALLSLAEDGRYRLEIAHGAETEPVGDLPVDRVDGPALLDEASAQRLLDATDEPSVFFRTAPDQQGQVLYRRYDGQFGIVELAPTSSRPEAKQPQTKQPTDNTMA